MKRKISIMNNVILFGTGNYAKNKMEAILKRFNVLGCIDNAVRVGMPEEFFGYKKVCPKEIGALGDYDYILLLSFKWYEMYRTLIKMGINEEKILFGNVLYPALDKTEELFVGNYLQIKSKNGKIHIFNEDIETICDNEEAFKRTIREYVLGKNDILQLIQKMPLEPLSKRFGIEYGTAIDRIYIKKFINKYRKNIRGRVMEIAEPKYAKDYISQITNLQILHVNGWGENVVKGDFSTGEGLRENSVDCLICTQTLLFIYDIHETIKNIYKVLNYGGTALVTVPGITQLSMYDYRNWGQYWAFTDQSLKLLFEEVFDKDKIEITVYGNVKTSIGFLYGIPAESFCSEDFEYTDLQYQVIIGIKVTK